MSTDTEQVGVGSTESVVDLAQRWYHVPALAVMMLYMLWVRFQSYGAVVRDSAVYFIGNDAYYHYRETMFAVKNWLSTMPFDPWTQFPFGTSTGQFGTLFDQLIAAGILVLGLGSPSDRQAAIAFAVAPAVIGTLCAVPVYYLGKRLSDRLGGLFAVLVLALLPGQFLLRSVVGFTDHHVGEVLFQTIAVLAMMVAVTVAEREKPVFEQFRDGDWGGLRETIKWSALAGLALALYLWTWPPGVVLVGVFGAFFAVALSIDVVHGRSPEHVAIVGALSLTIGAVLLLPMVEAFTFGSPTTMSLLHVSLALAVALGCVFLAWLARQWDQQGRDPQSYPLTVGAIGVAAIVVGSFVVPGVVDTVWQQMERALLLGQSDATLTIQEAQTTLSQPGGAMAFMFRNYGFTYVVAIIGFGWMTLGSLSMPDRYRSEHLLVAVWAVFVTLMALSQVRFHYYLAAVVAVLNAVALRGVFSLLGIPSFDRAKEVETYQVLAIAAAIVLIVFPIAVSFGAGGATAYQQANARQPGSVTTWDDSLDWMSENTPEPGTYGGADSEFAYYGSYSETNDYQYPDGAYGVMSWWDYGHWITVEGERPAVANPFQQGARTASAFFQAQSEERANLLLDALPAAQETDERIGEMSTAELRELVNSTSEQQQSEDTRYVMIDDQMAGEKFWAITQWTSPPDVDGMMRPGTGQYDNSMISELYFQDANGLSNYRLVHENERFSVVGNIPTRGGGQTWATSGPFAQGWNATGQTRLSLLQSGLNADVESTVKTYERVDGATLTGEAAPNQTVIAAVELETNANRPFLYTQSVQTGEDGTFSITVPYATNDELGPADGYTDSAVNATTSYSIVAGDNVSRSDYQRDGWNQNASISLEGTTNVSESAVVDGESVQVDLGEYDGGNASDGGNQTDGSGSDADGTDGSGSDGGNTTADLEPVARPALSA
ncbi:dolichyl-diphosphooligosaccharide--protein glycosyltransferase [Natronoarchaeum philippinense]|uniref:dolichyl-phosphooligosaccharide-protein glycotransferase n=1 Tax=Natronoarchaeum philippinense TaxID=558529 RepID=A0A285N1K2_NATPI|nr:oligosaccharyl transferase, archaeosortase A system-associated [Natronoarchaeum philippinense]SNZ03319.1 dolichyl-diphosphooligosaccharide--protein glycosyltransferase [Natronoarchaeum philippinense]